MNYSQETINKINLDIKNHFSHLKTIEPNYEITYNGISRMVMLDRYSQKDISLKTLGVGDLVLITISNHAKFPTRGIGIIVKIQNDIVDVNLEDEYIPMNNGNKRLRRNKSEVQKPLEIFYEQIAYRVGYALSDIEKTKENKKKFGKKFAEQIYKNNVVPAGRVLYGAGSKSNVTFFNCFVLPMIQDSREGISKHRQEIMEIMSRGGGVGTNGSSLRPKNAIAKGVSGKSSGSVSWLNDISKLTHLVEQGGSRRGAQMIMLADWHPDVIEFIISKMQNINILKWLKEYSKDELILQEIDNKMEFEPISNLDKDIYKGIVENPINFSEEIIKHAKTSLQLGGKWIVKDKDYLTGANISITISNNFMKAIKENLKWELKYPDLDNLTLKQKKFYDENWHKMGDVREWSKLGYPVKTYYTIKARELWNLICFCATYSAEPGVFFLDTANKFTNAKVYNQKVVATNPCGEQPLAPYSVCNLAAVNLANFVDKNTKKTKWDELKETLKLCVRMQDNVIDSTPYFLKENKEQALGERRIGMGVMGLHDMLIWLGIKYGSKESIIFLDKLFKFIAETAYETSADLAIEKGTFLFLEKSSFKKIVEMPFIKKLDPSIRKKISKTGLRNSHILTIAPTGSTGTMVGVSTGLEPYFALKYFRSGRLGKNIQVSIDIVKNWLKRNNESEWNENNLPNFFVTAMQLTPEEHLNTQCIIQKWVDSSISKTVNAPKGFTVKQVENIYMKLFDGGAKGGTVYVDGSRDAQVLSLSIDEGTKKKIFKTKMQSTIKDAFGTDEIDVDLTSEVPIIDASLRSDRQGREIGINEGNLCPICKEGTVVSSGGCNTCSNCGSQLKCGL